MLYSAGPAADSINKSSALEKFRAGLLPVIPVLKVYNTLAREKQPFVPIEPGTARMYVCGMTVYDYCHLGHARVMVVFDVIARWLRASGYRVTYVRNITDIDDKIIARAAENGEPIGSLTSRFIEAMHEDAQALGVAMPDLEPRATEYVDAMVAMISTLIAKGLAYVAKNGDVYYAVHNFPGYGKLSGKTLDELKAGERVEVEPAKRDPLDFALWKAAKPGEPAWQAPWSLGRPGWHIECSVMSTALLGPHFDIHGGGQDLQFPHHENEIAQSEGAYAVPFVNYWLHNGFVRVDNEKMSKSLGNFFTVREVLARYQPEVVRFFMLRAHYRSALNYSDQHLEDAKRALEGFYLALRGMSGEAPPVSWDNPFAARFRAAMNDDFDTHGAITVLFEVAHELNKSRSKRDADLLKSLGAILGLLQQNPEDYLQGARRDVSASAAATGLSPEQIETLIAQRSAARKARDFGEADRIRAQLSDAGVLLEDAPGRTVWRRA